MKFADCAGLLPNSKGHLKVFKNLRIIDEVVLTKPSALHRIPFDHKVSLVSGTSPLQGYANT